MLWGVPKPVEQHGPEPVAFGSVTGVLVTGVLDDQLAEQRFDRQHGGCVQGQRVHADRKADQMHVGVAVGTVLVDGPRRYPDGPGRRCYPPAPVGGDREHAAGGVDDLVLVVVVGVDPRSGCEVAQPGGCDRSVAGNRH